MLPVCHTWHYDLFEILKYLLDRFGLNGRILRNPCLNLPRSDLGHHGKFFHIAHIISNPINELVSILFECFLIHILSLIKFSSSLINESFYKIFVIRVKTRAISRIGQQLSQAQDSEEENEKTQQPDSAPDDYS